MTKKLVDKVYTTEQKAGQLQHNNSRLAILGDQRIRLSRELQEVTDEIGHLTEANLMLKESRSE